MDIRERRLDTHLQEHLRNNPLTEPLGCRESQTPQSDEPERKRKKPDPEVGKRTIILCSLYRNIVSPPQTINQDMLLVINRLSNLES